MRFNLLLLKQKTLFSLIVFAIFFSKGYGQVPQGINYQGVLRDKSGIPIKNQTIGVLISIYDSILNRQVNYVEKHSVQTNEFGLYTIVVGHGTSLIGKLDSIPWGLKQQFLEVKIDPLGGPNYTLIGSQALYSVPYAFHAGTSEKVYNSQKIFLKNDSLGLTDNAGIVSLSSYLDNTDSQKLIKEGNLIKISNGNGIKLMDDDSSNELQYLSISGDTLRLSKSSVVVKLPNPLEAIEDAMGCVFVHRFCTGDGTFSKPWISSDKSAGIIEALSHLTPSKRIVYFKPGYYATQGALNIDFSKYLPNLNLPEWKNSFAGFGIEFQGHNASIYVNGGAPLTIGKPGVLFNWKGEHAFYWKFTGLQFLGVVDTALVQFGNGYDFPWNGCEFDLVGNNGYVPSNYQTKASRSSAIKICWPLESKLHLVAVSACGSGAVLETATFCTIQGAFSNTIIPNTNTIYPKSYGLNLINCQSNTITHMDLEIAFNGIKFDQWSIQNTFSAIFVSQCDSLGCTFDNSKQVTNGKNVVVSIRSGPTVQAPSATIVQKLFGPACDPKKIMIQNYFDF
ncbi:MAG: hypothetical protein RLZZ60_1712 [Bacteroidota bacterium]|jgi:hypothetical protein